MFLNLYKNKNNSNRNLKVGEYNSIVTKIAYHPDYVEGTALQICYTLTNASGDTFSFKETFMNNSRNERTRDFFKYLVDNGISIDRLEDFCGCKEKVVLKKNATNRGTFLTIVEREFISEGFECEFVSEAPESEVG